MAREIGEKERLENIRKSEHARAEMEKAKAILGCAREGKWVHGTYQDCQVWWTTKNGEFDARVKLLLVFDVDKVVPVARAIMDVLES